MPENVLALERVVENHRGRANALRLAPPCRADAAELLDFELRNRAYFEHWINARPAEFYSLEGVRAAIATSNDEAARDAGFQYLVRDGSRLVGRVNLARVQRPYFNKAEIGYRIGADCAGQGYASAAVREAVALAFGAHALWRVEATVRADNAGSLRVLGKAGFRPFGRSRDSMYLGGRWHDLEHLEIRNDALCAQVAGDAPAATS